MRAYRNKITLTGDDLRSALALLAEFEPDSQRVLTAVLAAAEPSPGQAGHPGARGSRRPTSRMPAWTWSRRSVTALGAAIGGVAVVVAVLVAAGTLAGPGRGPRIAGPGQSAAALRQAILTAFQSTQGEIAYSRTTDSLGGRVVATARAWDWEGAAPPRWMRRQLLMTPAGRPVLELAENAVPTRSCVACARDARITLVIASYPARAWTQSEIRAMVTWGREPLSATQIRQVVAAGSLRVIGRTALAGVSSIKLAPTKNANGSRYLLWVNPRTYLPVRFEQVLTRPSLDLPAGLTISTSFQFLHATRPNLALLRPVRPSGPGWQRKTTNSFDSRPPVLLHDTRYAPEWLTIFQLLAGK